MATMFKKTMQNKFDRLKTDEARIKFIMKELEKEGWGDSIYEDHDNKYMLGTIWNPVVFDKKLFNKIKPKLERHQERETYTVHYYWTLKGKY